MEKFFKKTGLISILESVVFIILGVILVWKADVAVKVISYIIGTIFIIIGAAKVIKYFSIYKKQYEIYNYELIYGLITIVIGIITIYYCNTIETILRIVIGIWIIYSSFIKFGLALKMKEVGVRLWIHSLILSIIMFICGLYVILNSGTIIATIGICMIIYSVIDIIEDVICLKNIKDLL